MLSGIGSTSNTYEEEILQRQDRQPDHKNGQFSSDENVASGIRTQEISEAVYGGYVIPQNNAFQEMPTEILAEGYYVKNHNNRVVVYHMDQETVFLMTEIYVSELPNDVQEKLNQGIVMTDEGSLYDFLENYTS